MSTVLKSYGRDAVSLGWVRRSAALWLCLLYLVLVVSGFFSGARSWIQLSAIAAFLIAAGGVLADRFVFRAAGNAEEPGESEGPLSAFATTWERTSSEMEVGAALMVVAYAFLQIAGPLSAHIYPVVYILVAFLVTFQPSRSGWMLVGLATAIEVTSFVSGVAVGGLGLSAAGLVLHVAFIFAFGTLNSVFARVDLRKQRETERRRSALEDQLLRSNARELRFSVALAEDGAVETSQVDRPEAETRLIIDAIDAVNTSVDNTLKLLKIGLGCRTVALLWFDNTGRRLRIRDAISDSKLATTLNPGEGALAGVLRRREPVVLNDLRKGYRGLAYYRNPEEEPVRAFCGVPVVESDEPVGALCLDRSSARAFSAAEVEVIERAAEAIVRTIQTERFFLAMERTRHEVSRFYEASRQLNHALTPEEVYQVALECIDDICNFDLAAVVLTREGEQRRHFEVVRVDAPERDPGRPSPLGALAESLRGATFPENSGLVSMAVEMAHYLPYNGEYHESRSVVFSRKLPLKGVQSVIVLPLIAHDSEMGAFVIACRDAGAFPRGRREMVEVIANQVAISLHNAHMYERMEQMATTDGLTGLNNHRTFQRCMDEAIARVDRNEAPLTMILTDIDHFKSINDTYGHPVGDEVLREVSKTFMRVLRQTDIPARYGGEEFAVVLEGTGFEGAMQIAERLRAEIEKLSFNSTVGPFGITMSFGVGQYPDDGNTKALLIDHADQSLYYAKTHGRNQVRAWTDIKHAEDLGEPKKK